MNSNDTGYRKAHQLFTNGDYDGVIEACDDEINSEGDKIGEALLLRATFYLLKGQSAEARPDLNNLIAMDNGSKKVCLIIELISQFILSTLLKKIKGT